MIDANYTDKLTLLANTPAQAEFLLHNLEQTARGIGFWVNANVLKKKTTNKQKGAISMLSGKPLKLVDLFIHLDSNISSTENVVDICLTKAWNAIDGLLIIWKSDPCDKIRWDLFQAVAVSILLYGYTTWTLTKNIEKKLDENYTRMLNAVSNRP